MSAPKAAKTARPAPLFRPTAYDAADQEARFCKKSGAVLPSPALVRMREAIKAAIRLSAEARSVPNGRARIRKYVAALNLPLFRLVGLNERASREYFDGPMAASEAADAGVSELVWRWNAGDVHRATLALLLDVEPQSYADVKDQLDMLFHTNPKNCVSDKQRAAVNARLVRHFSRMLDGLPFKAPRARRSKARD